MSVFIEALRRAIEGWPFELSAAQTGAMEAFAQLLGRENERVNLTAITDPAEMAALHFADSLLPAALGLQLAGRCIDVGTGAGFPGVPLAIAYPGLGMTLLDSQRKRVEFLHLAQESFGFDAQIVHMRAELAGHDAAHRERYDMALSRAVAPLCVLAELMLPLVRVGGVALAWKGPRAGDELREADTALRLLGAEAELAVCHSAWGERAIVCMRKVAATPPKYPRKPGMPEKRPLASHGLHQ